MTDIPIKSVILKISHSEDSSISYLVLQLQYGSSLFQIHQQGKDSLRLPSQLPYTSAGREFISYTSAGREFNLWFMADLSRLCNHMANLSRLCNHTFANTMLKNHFIPFISPVKHAHIVSTLPRYLLLKMITLPGTLPCFVLWTSKPNVISNKPMRKYTFPFKLL